MLKKPREYFASFDVSVREGVLQALEHFECCKDILPEMQEMSKEHLKMLRELEGPITQRGKEAVKGVEGKTLSIDLPLPPPPQRERQELPPMTTVVGFCPRCGEKVVGMPITGCSKKEARGRTFYKECAKCTYYSEIFYRAPPGTRRKKFMEVEGGETDGNE